MRIGWVSFHRESLPALEAVLAAGNTVDFIITLEPEAAAKRSGAVDFRNIAEMNGIALLEVKHIHDAECLEFLHTRKPDLLVVLGWSQILGEEILTIPRIGTIGAHASLLPHNRGSAPVNWAIIKGETEGGNSMMWLDAGIDTGEVIDQTAFSITPFDNCATVYEKVAESNAEMLLKLLKLLQKGERPGRPQPISDEPRLPRRRPNDGLIDWSQDSNNIYNFIRGLTRPYPGAFTWADGRRLFVWRAALLPELVGASSECAEGSVIGPVISPDAEACGLLVACGSGLIMFLELEDAETGELFKGRQLCNEAWFGLKFGGDNV